MIQLIIGLKIDSYKSFAECAKVVRRFQNYSISELKKRVDSHNLDICFGSQEEKKEPSLFSVNHPAKTVRTHLKAASARIILDG